MNITDKRSPAEIFADDTIAGGHEFADWCKGKTAAELKILQDSDWFWKGPTKIPIFEKDIELADAIHKAEDALNDAIHAAGLGGLNGQITILGPVTPALTDSRVHVTVQRSL